MCVPSAKKTRVADKLSSAFGARGSVVQNTQVQQGKPLLVSVPSQV